jgi:SAM-dependent methyltransferase
VRGFDISSEAIELARTRHPAIKFQQADAVALPVPSQSADVFVSLETIEHLGEEDAARAFVSEVARVLKPDGIFICSTPDRSVYNPGKPPNATPWNRFHVREYDRSEFAALLRRKFASVEMFGQNPRSTLFAKVLHTLGRSPGNLAVRCAQVLKLARMPFDSFAAHAVVPAEPATAYEYLVAVSSRPS